MLLMPMQLVVKLASVVPSFCHPGACTWFSLQLQHSDFKALNIPIHEDLQKDIASLETLAQIALVFITIQQFPGARIPIKIPTLSDNTGAEAVSNKLFTTNLPLALFLEKLCLLISTSHVEVEVNHIPRQGQYLCRCPQSMDQLR